MVALYYTLEDCQADAQGHIPVYALKESLEAQIQIIKDRIETLS